MSKMSIGIDLGTTNSAVAFTPFGETEVENFEIPQLVQPGVLESRSNLPSFLYLPSRHEFGFDSLSLPWDEVIDFAVGYMARDEGSKVPDRLIGSAKSWLSQEALDPREAILPWKSPEEVDKLSPVEVTCRYLKHLCQSWRFSRVADPLEEQNVFLTVPASFDVVARDLTVEAARKAGLENITLLEEPQAAFYAWLQGQGDDWRELVHVGDRILVCDVGGGTADFTLIVVSQQDGQLALERVAVGDHLLLGGDNMDLALAMTVQQRIRADGTKLDNWQFQVLVHACRTAKERLLSGLGIDTCPVTIPGRGTKLLGGALKSEMLREDVEKVLLDGFLPLCASTDFAKRDRRLGLSELGLAFESDPAITRHLARFLGLHKVGQPTHVLFNGGVFKAAPLRQRMLDVLNSWLKAEGAIPVNELPGAELDMAVARGASYYGQVREGKGIRIRGGTSRCYYIGVEIPRPAIPGFEPPTKAVCVAPSGMEEGTSAELAGMDFNLVLGDTVEFPFLSSTTRNQDQAGASVEDWEDGDEIQRIATVTSLLKSEAGESRLIPVRLESKVTEIGTLELWCREKDGEGAWKLEFEVRAKTPVKV